MDKNSPAQVRSRKKSHPEMIKERFNDAVQELQIFSRPPKMNAIVIMLPNMDETKPNFVLSASYSWVFFSKASSIVPSNSGGIGSSSLSHMPEIEILNKIFKGLFEDIKTEDENKICFQRNLLFISSNIYANNELQYNIISVRLK